MQVRLSLRGDASVHRTHDRQPREGFADAGAIFWVGLHAVGDMALLDVDRRAADRAGGVVEEGLVLGSVHPTEQVPRLLVVVVVDTVMGAALVSHEAGRRVVMPPSGLLRIWRPVAARNGHPTDVEEAGRKTIGGEKGNAVGSPLDANHPWRIISKGASHNINSSIDCALQRDHRISVASAFSKGASYPADVS